MSHEIIYYAMQVYPRGALKRALIVCRRQYMPKKSGLSIYSQEVLDVIALSLNTRLRARLGYKASLNNHSFFKSGGNIRVILF